MRLRRVMWIAVLALLGIVIVAILSLVLLSWRRPELGLADGQLRPCPDSPNCVSSAATDEPHRIEPFPAKGRAFDRLRLVLASMPNITVVADEGDYLRAECTTPVFRFVDDIEFLHRPDVGVIDVRSASRVGRSDFGANRARVEEIRRRLSGSAGDGAE